MNHNRLFSQIDKVIFDFDLIKPGDRILIGASGGKDSTALIEYFANRKKRPDADFEFTALHVHSDFATPMPQNILELFRKWNVDYQEINVEVLGRLKKGKKMSCYWCSTQRRLELNRFAQEKGYNKLALGHHMDDVLETWFMNMFQKGEQSTMLPSMKYEKFPVTMIRPLYYSEEKVIIEHAKEAGYYGYTCTCDYQDNSTRKTARSKIALLTENDSKLKQHLFDSLFKINADYMPVRKND